MAVTDDHSRIVLVRLNANAQAWPALPLPHVGENPPDPQGSSVSTLLGGPGLVESANVHVHTADCVRQTTFTSICRGRLDLPGRTVPVSVVLWDEDKQPLSLKVHELLDVMHPKILPVLGRGPVWLGHTALVLPDRVGTDIRTYLKTHPDMNKHRLIVQVAEVLEYLHEQKSIVHGALVSRSVLVNDSGDVLLDSSTLITSRSRSGRVPERWELPYIAPEIVHAATLTSWLGPRLESREGDMYAFGTIVYETLSGREPWAGATLVDVFRHIVSRQLLPRPEDGTINDSMWSLCTACWSQNPADRPGIAKVLAGLRRDTPPTHWRADAAVGGDRLPRSELASPEEHTIYTPTTDVEVQIDGSVVKIVLQKQVPDAGAFGTVMRGYTYARGVTTDYAVKVCRGKSIMPREYEIWKSLSHDNILPLLGILDTNVSGSPERIFVSPYLINGNLVKYLKSHPGALRLPLMIDVAIGLVYLHNIKAIVHGDVKPENILINDSGSAMLADFGFSTYVAPRRRETLLEVRQVYTLAYCAPEVLDDTAEDPSAPGVVRSKTKMSDMYAYGVLLYQTYTGGIGSSQKDRIQLMLDMYDGRFPPRSVGGKPALCDYLWSMCKRCWAKNPLQRPPIATVLAELKDLEASPERQEIETVES